MEYLNPYSIWEPGQEFLKINKQLLQSIQKELNVEFPCYEPDHKPSITFNQISSTIPVNYQNKPKQPIKKIQPQIRKPEPNKIIPEKIKPISTPTQDHVTNVEKPLKSILTKKASVSPPTKLPVTANLKEKSHKTNFPKKGENINKITAPVISVPTKATKHCITLNPKQKIIFQKPIQNITKKTTPVRAPIKDCITVTFNKKTNWEKSVKNITKKTPVTKAVTPSIIKVPPLPVYNVAKKAKECPKATQTTSIKTSKLAKFSASKQLVAQVKQVMPGFQYGDTWCRFCGAKASYRFLKGPWGTKTLCSPHYQKWKKFVFNLPKEEPRQPLFPEQNSEIKYMEYILKKFKKY